MGSGLLLSVNLYDPRFRIETNKRITVVADILYFENSRWQGLETLRRTAAEYQLLLIFGSKEQLQLTENLASISQLFTEAKLVCGSSAGEIIRGVSTENCMVCIAFSMDHTKLAFSQHNIADFENAYALGIQTARNLPKEDLRYVFILSDGGLINGSELIEGISHELGPDVTLSGGMAGDGNRFENTIVGLNLDIRTGNLVLVGFYGNRLHIGVGIKGGFVCFGPQRTVTRSEKNILYEIDGQNALELYKRYLGKFSEELPGSALFFPVGILQNKESEPLVRTILSVDEEAQSMIFAGNIPTGSRIRLMRAPLDNLIRMASEAGVEALTQLNPSPDLAIVMNCVGRKIVLADRAAEEIESILGAFPEQTPLAGMYTYGEFSPQNNHAAPAQLNNQTVVVTLFHES